jgi:hypothetical protein
MKSPVDFLRSRWQQLRTDRSLQLFLLLSLVTLGPALYYDRLLLRTTGLFCLVWFALFYRFFSSDLAQIRLLGQEARLADPQRPPI